MPKRLGTIGYDPEIKRSYIVRHNRLGSATVILKYSLHFRTEWQLNGPQVTSVGYRTRMEFDTPWLVLDIEREWSSVRC